MWEEITEKDREQFNALVTHPLQSFEWGEFREATGINVIRKGFSKNSVLTDAFTLTIHPIPHTPWTIGYLPKGNIPTQELLEELHTIGKANKCIFIQLEPNIPASRHSGLDPESNNNGGEILNQVQDDDTFTRLGLRPAAHPLFTKYTFELDLTKPEETLLANMHPKTRYNIRVAQKHGVMVEEKNTPEAFEIFWKLTQETTSRQQFYAHTKKYHLTQWQTLSHMISPDMLSSHLLAASYQGTPLTSWIVFVFKDMLYYPYGASSKNHRETMHSTLMMWEAIKFGKKNNLKTFDLWGAAAPDAPSSDSWFGFTQFKERFGPARVELVGSYDLVIDSIVYQGYKIADKLRWMLLKVLR